MSRREVRLLLIRHGATSWSDARRLNGRTDVPLSAKGRRQARRLRPLVAAARAEVVFSSDLARARETAEIVIGGARLDPRLREFDFGSWEGRRWEEIPPPGQQALLAFDDVEAPGGESMVAFRARIASFLCGLEVDHCVVFTHGGVIRVIVRSTQRSTIEVPPGGHAEAVVSIPVLGRGFSSGEVPSKGSED